MKKRFIQKNVCLLLMLTMLLGIFGQKAYAENISNKINGVNRVKTSIEVSKTGWTKGAAYAILINDRDYAGSICAASLAKKYNAPILLTNSQKLDNETITELKRLKPKKVFIVGGPRVVKDKVNSQLRAMNIKNVERLWGNTCYDTALKVASKLGKVNTVFIAPSSSYESSLSVSSIAAKNGAPILFAQKNSIKSSVKNYIKRNKVAKVYVIGGKAAISDKALRGISNVERISGIDVYDTNKKIVQKFTKDINLENIFFVQATRPGSNEFAGALSISPLAAIKSAPVVVINRDLDREFKDFLEPKITTKTNLISIGKNTKIPTDIFKNVSLNLEVVKISGETGKPSQKVIEITKNNTVYGEEKSVKEIAADIFVKANNVALNHLNIKGTLTLDPGEKGSVDLKNIACELIHVKSGDINSIHLFNVEAKKIIVDSKTNVRLEAKGNTNINETEVKSSVILENVDGNFGEVVVSNTPVKQGSRDVELKGKFNNKVLVKGSANLYCKDGVNKVEICTTDNESNITVSGSVDTVNAVKAKNITLNGQFKKVNTNNEVKVEISKGSKVETITALGNSQIDIKAGAQVNKLEKSKNVKVTGSAKEIVEITDSGSGQSQTGDTFTLTVTKNNGSINILSKEVKIENNKKAMDYLKACTSVVDRKGLITEIDSIGNVSIGELSLEQREGGVLGIDWFIYLNGEKTDKGAKGITPKPGDILNFDFHEWDWHEMVGTGYSGSMPIKIEIPRSVTQGQGFKVRATCIFRPVYKAEVEIDGQIVGETDIDGYFTASIKTPGSHNVSVSKDGGTDESLINVTANGSSTGGDTGTGNNDENKGNISVEIKATENNKVDIVLKAKDNNNSSMVNIVLYNDKNALVYIGQGYLVNGKFEFNTVLEPGEYHGYYNEQDGQKVKIDNFLIK